ncbi:hypothetical protein GQ53DRAFT_888752 [Thozetella sp. PMI_491]|nr:hypothetical protein GQ53DRAFT_888752 [Thozetella sp. PMI_491]
MPRATLPPTPASSTDIKGQDGSKLSSLQVSFELPPPALTPAGGSKQGSTSPTVAADSTAKTAYPMQASESVKSRRRSSAAQAPKDQFALPPPPTRSRKIIQMKPRDDTGEETTSVSPRTAAAGASKNNPAVTTLTTQALGSKRKQPSATSAAGRKIARRTAHSLIERRRRSKMNEEFGVLKNMIPACTGEMHKLAILQQASIEYVRYLEDCVAKLKAERKDGDYTPNEPNLPTPSGREPYNPDGNYASSYADPRSPDVEMTNSEIPSPVASHHDRSQRPSISPALLAEDSKLRHDSYSSASTDRRHYSYSASATTSPAFGPQAYTGYAQSTHSASGSTLTSPALLPQRDLDQEATAALLMLNQTDRRGTQGNAAGRGMSVRDLLST